MKKPLRRHKGGLGRGPQRGHEQALGRGSRMTNDGPVSVSEEGIKKGKQIQRGLREIGIARKLSLMSSLVKQKPVKK
jgi:hypothetical protein